MKKPNYDWQILRKIEIPEDFRKIAEEASLSPRLIELLYIRGIRDKKKLEQFLEPKLEDLHDPFLLHDMDRAVARILKAIEVDQTILIYGDYDCDGITATTVMKEAIEELGGRVLTYLPNRFEDGYGPNKEVYAYFIEKEAIDLIITVDNGVAGNEAILYAKEKGIDVVVTDHHEMPSILPEAFAIIHPKHPSGDYPFKELAGVG
ncbi:MAG: DHH family phosphoesterase, partial [Streptococcaceae bacterium]|nr:DHH family phosphoesterase [Streptococcaceae bacterium]